MDVQNRLTALFERKQSNVLSVYCTAGFPALGDTIPVLEALQTSGVDFVEIGMPFSDPIADGPVIQQSSTKALHNGMTMERLFEQLRSIRTRAENPIQLPLVLMGYTNPVVQFGVERFCEECASVGIDGVILPDLPVEVFEQDWKPLFDKHGLHFIALITPQTSESRITKLSSVSGGFLYAVSSAGTTGGALTMDEARTAYFLRLQHLHRNGTVQQPVIIGFGISNKASFDVACEYASGAIIGSAFITAIAEAEDVRAAAQAFVRSVR
jgi:tryptophan synthase alpha chain